MHGLIRYLEGMELKGFQSLRPYFYDRLRTAQRRSNHRTDPATEHYLVEMLTRFGRADRESVADEPLCYEVAQAAATTDSRERLRRFRRIGDTALYSCGLFPEGLEQRGVSKDYVSHIGRRAYGMASALAAFSAEPFQAVYPALRREFEMISRVLTEVLETPPPTGADEILRVYAQWRRTGSAKLARSLQRAGIHLGEVVKN